MSDSYDIGKRGENPQNVTDWKDYEKGQHDRRQDQEAELNRQPKVAVSGVGLGTVLMAPFLVFMYPVAGVLSLAPVLLVMAATSALLKKQQFAQFLLWIVTAMAAFYFFAARAEATVSRFKAYRLLRHIFRMVTLGGLAFCLIITGGSGLGDFTLEKAFNKASGGAIFGALVAVVLMHFLFRALDRVFFPVIDPQAAAAAAAPGEALSEQEEWKRKNKIFHTVLWLAAAWVGMMVVLFLSFRKANALALTVVCTGVCWIAWKIIRKKELMRRKQ